MKKHLDETVEKRDLQAQLAKSIKQTFLPNMGGGTNEHYSKNPKRQSYMSFMAKLNPILT